MHKIEESNQLEFRGYPFYELTDYGYKFVFDEESIKEANNQGISEQKAYASILGKYCGMFKRDKLIVKALLKNNIKKVYDIGGDRGGLAKLLILNGIEVTVFEPRVESIKYMRSYNINCEQISVQELTKNFSKYIPNDPKTAILCLNFTHVKWNNENEKNAFFEVINKSNAEIFIFSWFGKISNIFTEYYEESSFNLQTRGYFFHRKFIGLANKLRLSKYIKYINFLMIETEYETMQRLLKKK